MGALKLSIVSNGKKMLKTDFLVGFSCNKAVINSAYSTLQ